MFEIKKLFYRKMQFRCSAAINVIIYVLIGHSGILCTGWHWRCSVGARSCFRWRLHPSIQAWPLLSTSNRGEAVIAKCGNYFRGESTLDTWKRIYALMNWVPLCSWSYDSSKILPKSTLIYFQVILPPLRSDILWVLENIYNHVLQLSF